MAHSPDKAFRIETKRQQPLTISKDGTRKLGTPDSLPVANLIRSKDGETLLELDVNVEGPVEAHWSSDSTHVIIYWDGYRYNDCHTLVRATGSPKEIDVGTSDLHEVIRHDLRPVWEREAQTYEGEPDTSPPFEKKRWKLTPIRWLPGDRVLVSAVEFPRLPGVTGPYQIGVESYFIEAEITDKGFVPRALYAGSLGMAKPIWKNEAEQSPEDLTQEKK